MGTTVLHDDRLFTRLTICPPSVRSTRLDDLTAVLIVDNIVTIGNFRYHVSYLYLDHAQSAAWVFGHRLRQDGQPVRNRGTEWIELPERVVTRLLKWYTREELIDHAGPDDLR